MYGKLAGVLGTATRDSLDYYTCPVNFHVVQRGLMGGDICRMCLARSIADGNGAECWASMASGARLCTATIFSAGRIMRMNAADREAIQEYSRPVVQMC